MTAIARLGEHHVLVLVITDPFAATLGHFSAYTWHFADLVALGCEIIAAQSAPATGASRGPEFDEAVYLCGRQQPSGAALMAGLAAALAPLRLAWRLPIIRGRSDDGGREELLEFWPSRSRSSAISALRSSTVATCSRSVASCFS